MTRAAVDASHLRRLSTKDQGTVDGWLALLTAAHAHDSRGRALTCPPPCRVDMVGSLRFAPPDTELEDWVVRRDGHVLGSLRLALPHGARVMRVDQLVVHPLARRAGIGRMLWEYAVARAARHDRHTLSATVVEPLPGGPHRHQSPAAFAEAAGAVRAATAAGLHQWLDLAEHDPLVDGVPAVPAGYALVPWGTTTPDEHAVAVSWLERTLGTSSTEPPDEPPATSYARRFEVMRIGRGRRAYHTGVVHQASGRLVGYTSISKTTGNPRHALQGMTVVHTAHRGHGLGLVIKLANLAMAREHEPALRMVETTNDETNAAMVAVNAAMGFRPHDRWVTWTGRT